MNKDTFLLQDLCVKLSCWPILRFYTTVKGGIVSINTSIYINSLLFVSVDSDCKSKSQKLACTLALSKLKMMKKKLRGQSNPNIFNLTTRYSLSGKVLSDQTTESQDKTSIFNIYPLIYSDPRSENAKFYSYILSSHSLNKIQQEFVFFSEKEFEIISNILVSHINLKLIKADNYALNMMTKNFFEIKYLGIVKNYNTELIPSIIVSIADILYESSRFQAYICENTIKFPDLNIEILIVSESSLEVSHELRMQSKNLSSSMLDIMKLLRIWKFTKVDFKSALLDILVTSLVHESHSLGGGFRMCLEAIAGGIFLNGSSLELLGFEKEMILDCWIAPLQDLAQQAIIYLSLNNPEEVFG